MTLSTLIAVVTTFAAVVFIVVWPGSDRDDKDDDE